MTTQNPDRKDAFVSELVSAIRAEQNYFNMAYFTKLMGDAPPTSCATASCIAGHIQALRPERAAELAAAGHYQHASRAAAIWQEETGEPCRLDFYGVQAFRDEDGFTAKLRDITRKQAIAHILDQAEDSWPQLPADHDEY